MLFFNGKVDALSIPMPNWYFEAPTGIFCFGVMSTTMQCSLFPFHAEPRCHVQQSKVSSCVTSISTRVRSLGKIRVRANGQRDRGQRLLAEADCLVVRGFSQVAAAFASAAASAALLPTAQNAIEFLIVGIICFMGHGRCSAHKIRLTKQVESKMMLLMYISLCQCAVYMCQHARTKMK